MSTTSAFGVSWARNFFEATSQRSNVAMRRGSCAFSHAGYLKDSKGQCQHAAITRSKAGATANHVVRFRHNLATSWITDIALVRTTSQAKTIPLSLMAISG